MRTPSNMPMGAGPMSPGGDDDETAMRRRALSRMLMGQGVPQEAYRTSEGAMMGAGTQAIQGMAQNPQFMKWLTSAFQAAPSGAPMGGGGIAGGG